MDVLFPYTVVPHPPRFPLLLRIISGSSWRTFRNRTLAGVSPLRVGDARKVLPRQLFGFYDVNERIGLGKQVRSRAVRVSLGL